MTATMTRQPMTREPITEETAFLITDAGMDALRMHRAPKPAPAPKTAKASRMAIPGATASSDANLLPAVTY